MLQFLLGALLIISSCSTYKERYDYLVKTQRGTFLCDEYRNGVAENCEHVLQGYRVKRITEFQEVEFIVE